MSDFTDELTSYYYCNESSGTTLIDSRGGKDSTDIIGVPTLAGDHWKLRAAVIRWSVAGTYLESDGDYSEVLVLRIANAAQSFQPFIYGNTPVLTGNAPTLLHNNNDFISDSNQNGSGLTVSNGGPLSETDIISIARSYNASTRQMHLAIKSTEGIDISASYVDATPVADKTETVIGTNNTLAVLTDMDLFRLGFLKGNAKPLTDLQDTAQAFLDLVTQIPVDGSTSNFNSDGSLDVTLNVNVEAGDVVAQGELVGITKRRINADVLGALSLGGVYNFPKPTSGGSEIAVGQSLYWNPTTKQINEIFQTGSLYIGKAVKSANQSDTHVTVRMSNE